MKAVIPAAGEGKRFNKDSTYMHKCLVPINGKALLLYTLENLTNIKEITECIVIIGENHEKIIDTIGTKVNDTPILFCKQKQSVKGVVGAIESAVEEIGNDDFILVLADEFVYENNYAEAIEKFKTSTNECMVGLYYEKHLEYVKKNYTFIKSPDGFLYNFIEKPQIVYNNCSGTGNIIFKNTVLGAIKKVKENKERHEKELVDLLNLICATGKIQSFVVGNYYCNVNNMNDYVTRGTSIDYYSQNILRNILSEIKSMDINIDITVGNDKKVMERLSAEYEHVRNIHFYNFVDQWKMLANHEIFISHGGLSGVREAILCETPMIVYPSNYHDYQVGLAIERNNIGIMIKDRKLSHGNTCEVKNAIYKILSTDRYTKKIKEVKEEFTDLYKKDKIISYLNEIRIN